MSQISELNPGSSLHGFTLQEKAYLEEVAADCCVLHHEQSGAELLFIDAPDVNRVFSIAFRTPPRDSAGEAHIIEHCVLNGSRKYRSREPFMDMSKGSLATFLNAMTYPDKTVYPVASRNLTDFHNLMDVYLDAVFHPRLHEDERIFRQEGWRLELDSPQGPLQRNGVVYNEMKGAYSDPQQLLFQELMAQLLPDTPYAHVSGGDPEHIPELTYEGFVDFHRSCYHPANSWIFLYGELDLHRELEYLDREYLSSFTFEEPQTELALQTAPAAMGARQLEYPIGSDEPADKRHYLAYGYVSGGADTPEDNMMLRIAQDVLFFSQGAPVRRAIVGQGLAEDLGSVSFTGQQTIGGLAVINARADAVETLPELIERVIREDLAAGISEERMLAPLHQLEYTLRADSQATRGLTYAIRSLQTSIYGGSLLDGLRYQDTLNRVRERLNAASFADFVTSRMLNNPHKAVLHLVPVPGLAAVKTQQDEAELAQELGSMSVSEREELIAKTADFRQWQQSEDGPEELATIPRLRLTDVSPQLKPGGQDSLHAVSGATLLRHTDATMGIHYLTFSFDVDQVPDEDLPLAALLAHLYGQMNTALRSYDALDTALRLGTGGISTSLNISRSVLPAVQPHLRFTVHGRAMDRELDELFNLMAEMLLQTDFSDERRLLELLGTLRTRLENDIASDGLQYANTLATASFSLAAQMSDRIEGVAFYDVLCDFEEELRGAKVPEGQAALSERLTKLAASWLKRRGTVVLCSTDEAGQNQLDDYIAPFLQHFPLEGEAPAVRHFTPRQGALGIQTNAQVQFVSQAFDYQEAGGSYSGSLAVVAQLLSRTWLHQRIRAQGGAYGTGLGLDRRGTGVVWSYRDPEAGRTLDTFAELAQALADLKIDRDELETSIIGTVNRFDPPRTPQAEGLHSLRLLLTDQNHATVNRSYQELLATQPADLTAFAPILESALGQNHICVIGSADTLAKEAERFQQLRKLQGEEL